MTRAEVIATEGAWGLARRMKQSRRTFGEIAAATGLPVHEVARELASSEVGRKRWTAAQLEHLRKNAKTPAARLAKEVSAIGPQRSEPAVTHKLNELNLVQRRGRPRTKILSWPVMNGSDEERDATFVQLVRAEALRVFYGRAA